MKDGGDGRRTSSKSPRLTPGVDVKYEHEREPTKMDHVVKAEGSDEDGRIPTPSPSVNGKRKAEDEQGEAKRIKVEEGVLEVEQAEPGEEQQMENGDENMTGSDVLIGDRGAVGEEQIEAAESAESATDTIGPVAEIVVTEVVEEAIAEEDDKDEEVEQAGDRENLVSERVIKAETLVTEAVAADGDTVEGTVEDQSAEASAQNVGITESSVVFDNPDEISIPEDELATTREI